MMPQRETSESIYEQADPTYGSYEGNQTFARHSDERAGAQPLKEARGEKVYPELYDHKNMFRLGMFVIAMVTLLLCAVLFVFFLGGTGGWVSFIVAAFAIFLVTVVAIDKIQ
jgi:hypothetical protein